MVSTGAWEEFAAAKGRERRNTVLFALRLSHVAIPASAGGRKRCMHIEFKAANLSEDGWPGFPVVANAAAYRQGGLKAGANEPCPSAACHP